MARTEVREGMIWVIEPEGEWMLGPETEVPEIKESLEDKIARLEAENLALQENQIILMDAMATLYEEVLLISGTVVV